ncbi:MAG: hypothetical protein EBR02_06600 [Alphaproteobacteria bacterium]|nr:hypothetical protein [Alphaproteobacteria bacterium]
MVLGVLTLGTLALLILGAVKLPFKWFKSIAVGIFALYAFYELCIVPDGSAGDGLRGDLIIGFPLLTVLGITFGIRSYFHKRKISKKVE